MKVGGEKESEDGPSKRLYRPGDRVDRLADRLDRPGNRLDS